MIECAGCCTIVGSLLVVEGFGVHNGELRPYAALKAEPA